MPRRLNVLNGQHFHLFLSHNNLTGSDQMRVSKERLKAVLPGLRVMLQHVFEPASRPHTRLGPTVCLTLALLP